ncbi:GYDIA family GHMP kinase [Halpernia sp. GG3]
MNSNSYFSPGKLLLTSEYLVLDGALALAIPTKLGQEMSVKVICDEGHLINWKAFHENKPWLNLKIDCKNWQVLETNIPNSAEFILKVFKIIDELNPIKFKENLTYHFKTNLQFPANFGLGSSSTLMNNLAQWAEVNPFLLNEKSLGGSGYDIAVAKENSAILFQKINEVNQITKVEFKPAFINDLILIHLNQKQDSREGINHYRSKSKSEKLVKEFSELTESILKAQTIEEFSTLMEIHESKLSDFLGLETVKSRLFSDCPVFIKSLGAWGGDFILSRKFPDYKNYFISKNFPTVFDWNILV